MTRVGCLRSGSGPDEAEVSHLRLTTESQRLTAKPEREAMDPANPMPTSPNPA
jgi:hypothetical protein